MNHLTNLFNVLELTRNQPQTGYAIWGGGVRMGNLAEHHYLVIMVAWQLAVMVNEAGGSLDLCKIFEFAATHDIGELFGGDISMPYAKANPKAREYAKKFEAENHVYVSKFFGSQSQHILDISTEILDADCDEARVAKIADYIEVTHYKFFIGRFLRSDVRLVSEKIRGMIRGMKSRVARKHLTAFVRKWEIEMSRMDSYPEMISRVIV